MFCYCTMKLNYAKWKFGQQRLTSIVNYIQSYWCHLNFVIFKICTLSYWLSWLRRPPLQTYFHYSLSPSHEHHLSSFLPLGYLKMAQQPLDLAHPPTKGHFRRIGYAPSSPLQEARSARLIHVVSDWSYRFIVIHQAIVARLGQIWCVEVLILPKLPHSPQVRKL